MIYNFSPILLVGTLHFSTPTSATKSPFWIFTDLPALMASGNFPTIENMSSSPTAVSTLPSITPMGGQKKPPTISSTLNTNDIRNMRAFEL